MKIRLTAPQIEALRPWLERRDISVSDSQVGRILLVTGAAGPRLKWLDREGMWNEDFLTDADWSKIERLLMFEGGDGYGFERDLR